MGSSISAKKLGEALSRATKVGIVEERFSIGDCEMVLRNLRPDEYQAVIDDCKDLEEVTYMYGYQSGHVARALVEMNGVNLRDVKYVEVEEEDPKTPGSVRAIKIELYKYVLDHVMNTWSKEAVFTSYRKFADVIQKAEEKAKEGIVFITPDETPEEKFRRLLGDLREVESDVPENILDKVLEEAGYMRRSTAEEVKATMERADQLARERLEAEKAAQQGAAQESPAAPAAPPAAPSGTGVPRIIRTPTADDVMRNRQPLNRQPVEVPAPPPMAGEPGSFDAPQQQPFQQPHVPITHSKRAAEVAALEAEVGIAMVGNEAVPVTKGPGGIPVASLGQNDAPELARGGAEKQDVRQFHQIVERPPTAGLNPRFRPPPR